MRQLYVFLCLLVLYSGWGILSGCKKAEPPLPDAVVGGDNVFACHINGKSFIAHDHADLFGSSSKAVEGGFWGVFVPYERTNNFWLIGSTEDGDMELYISFCDSAGLYSLQGNVPCPTPTCVPLINYAAYQHSYFTTEQQTGLIKIDYLLRSADEIRGTFAFKAVDKKGNRIDVTDGRFYYKHR